MYMFAVMLVCRSLAQARSDPESSFVLQFGQGRALWHPLHIHCNFTRNMCTWIEEIPAFAVSLNLGDVKVSHITVGTGSVILWCSMCLSLCVCVCVRVCVCAYARVCVPVCLPVLYPTSIS